MTHDWKEDHINDIEVHVGPLLDEIQLLTEALQAICKEADSMAMTMRRRKIFDAGKAALRAFETNRGA